MCLGSPWCGGGGRRGSYCLGTETVLVYWLFLLNVASHALESQLSLRCIPKVRPTCPSKGGMLMDLRQGDQRTWRGLVGLVTSCHGISCRGDSLGSL